MARNMYGATSADFTLTSGGRVVPGAELTIWDARTGGTQITDLLDVDSVACTTVTSDAAGAVVYYGPDSDKTVHWADSGQGARVAIRPVDITGDPPVISVGTVTTGTAGATLTGTSEAPVLNLVLPSAGANGVNTAAIQDSAVTSAKIAADTITAANIASNAVTSDELADNAVDTAAIANGAVTDAKLAGSISPSKVTGTATTAAQLATTDAKATAAQASVDTLAASIGNLLTPNQAKPTTPGAYTAINATEGAAGVYTATGTSDMVVQRSGITVTGREMYTAIVTATVARPNASVLVSWRDAGGSQISLVGSGKPADFAAGVSTTVVVTLAAPLNAVTAVLYPVYTGSGSGGDVITLTTVSFHKGTGGQWAMPGTPIVGQSRIAVNDAVDLSGTAAPEGTVSAALGSTYLQTSGAATVTGMMSWRKTSGGTGKTGWSPEGALADTEWRDVSASIDADWTGATVYPTLQIRRIGAQVFFRGNVKRVTASGARNSFDTVYTTPTGFRGTDGNEQSVGSGSNVTLGRAMWVRINYNVYGDLALYDFGGGTYAANEQIVFDGSWSTTDAWPTSLPGSAA